MRRDIRLLAKFLLMLIGCFLFLFLLGKAVVHIVEPILEKEHTYITTQEAGNLVWLLSDTAKEKEPSLQANCEQLVNILSEAEGDWETLLTYEQARSLMECLPQAQTAIPTGYGKQEKVKTDDFFAWFDHARTIYDPEGKITDQEILILGAGEEIRTADGASIAEDMLMTQDGLWGYHTPYFLKESCQYKKIISVGYEGELYGIRRIEPEEAVTLSNVWIIDMDDGKLTFFWRNCEIRLTQTLKGFNEKKELIADLTFQDGKLQDAAPKEEKVSGRLLRVTDEGIELEGMGFLAFADSPAFYKLYGPLNSLDLQELRIGYTFTDFVLENGKVAAGLVVKEENMEYIRVLIQNAGYSGPIHDSIRLYADCDCMLYSGEGENAGGIKLAAGDVLEIRQNSSFFRESDRIRIVPDVLTGRIFLPDVSRSETENGYRGLMEVSLQENGLILINEVLLEEYLYAVVPSEMPASYPMEALKSQAVCARTYAYEKMCHAGLPEYGAHLDDSTAFQVYQNQEEQAESTRAVRETNGMTLFWNEDPAEIFYYSTSCGYGTNADVWQEGNALQYPYLKALSISDQSSQTDYECDEPWYRWEYTSDQIDVLMMEQKLKDRYRVNPSAVLSVADDGSFFSKEPEQLGELLEINIIKRGEGNVASQMMIRGTKGAYLVKTEYNIRYLLCDGASPAIRQDGSDVTMSTILPSAFLEITVKKEDNRIVGYTINGGGFGHGVGMSQNGAKNMAVSDMGCEEILTFFYRGCEIKNIYR